MLTEVESREVQQAVEAARYLLTSRAPYYSFAVFQMPVVGVTDLPGVALDKWARIYVGFPWCTTVTPQELSEALEHEVNHMLRAHYNRLHDFDNRLAAGVSACIEITDDLAYPFPDMPTPATFGLQDDQTAEWYYNILTNADGAADNGDLDDAQSCGSGSGGETQPWEIDGDDGTQLDQMQQDQIADVVARDIQEHMRNNPGTVPGHLERWADRMLAKPEIPWHQVLSSFLGTEAARAAGRSDHSRHRPGRRSTFGQDGVIHPTMTGQNLAVGIVIDTSGSMSAQALGHVLTETDSILNRLGVDHCWTVACDADVSDIKKVRRASEAGLTGGGGTDMVAGIAAFLMAERVPDVIIVATDGYTPWPAVDPGVPVIVCLIGTQEKTPDWVTRVVHVKGTP